MTQKNKIGFYGNVGATANFISEGNYETGMGPSFKGRANNSEKLFEAELNLYKGRFDLNDVTTLKTNAGFNYVKGSATDTNGKPMSIESAGAILGAEVEGEFFKGVKGFVGGNAEINGDLNYDLKAGVRIDTDIFDGKRRRSPWR